MLAHIDDLGAWHRYLERVVYRRPLQEDDLIFPSIGRGGVAQEFQQISADDVQKLIDEFATESGTYKLLTRACRLTADSQPIVFDEAVHNIVSCTPSKAKGGRSLSYNGGEAGLKARA